MAATLYYTLIKFFPFFSSLKLCKCIMINQNTVESEISKSYKLWQEVNLFWIKKKIVLAQILRIFSDALTFHACTQQ